MKKNLTLLLFKVFQPTVSSPLHNLWTISPLWTEHFSADGEPLCDTSYYLLYSWLTYKYNTRIQIKIESLILSYYPTVPLVNLHITWAWHFTILHILYGWKKSQSIIHMYYTVYVFTNSAALLVAACSTSLRIFPEQVQSTFLKGKSRTTERRRNPSVNIRSMQG